MTQRLSEQLTISLPVSPLASWVTDLVTSSLTGFVDCLTSEAFLSILLCPGLSVTGRPGNKIHRKHMFTFNSGFDFYQITWLYHHDKSRTVRCCIDWQYQTILLRMPEYDLWHIHAYERTHILWYTTPCLIRVSLTLIMQMRQNHGVKLKECKNVQLKDSFHSDYLLNNLCKIRS